MAYSSDIKLVSKTQGYLGLVLLFMYYILHVLQTNGLGPSFFRFYGKDLIILPILMISTTVCIRLLGNNFRVGAKELVIAVIYMSLSFELIFPGMDLAYPGDWRDVLCYIAGGLGYHTLIVKEKIIA